jgi:hypothetical protein
MTMKLMVLAGVLISSAAHAGSGPSFTKDLAPILKTRCATCHLTGAEAGRMALHPAAAYDSLVKVQSIEAANLKRVQPHKPEASYLLMKLEGTHIANGGKGARMPFGAPPLPPEQIALF